MSLLRRYLEIQNFKSEWFVQLQPGHFKSYRNCNLKDKAQEIDYRKVPKFSDTRNLCFNRPKIQTKRPNLMVFCQKAANRIANSEDPDQTSPLGAV